MMSYRIIVLGASASGKSTLMRYLRRNTGLKVIEMDEELVRANGGKWPVDITHKNTLIEQVASNLAKADSVMCIASFIPTQLIKASKDNGFTVVILQVPKSELEKRNKKRISEEKYEDVSKWFEMQLQNYRQLSAENLIDKKIDGSKSTIEIAAELAKLTEGN